MKYLLDEEQRQIALVLVSLPNELAAVEINYALNSPDIEFHRTRHGVSLRTIRDHDAWNSGFATFITENIDLDTLHKTASITVQCHIEITKKYGLFGGIYSTQNQPIVVQSAVDHKLLISGFIDQLFAFDPIALCQTPDVICNLILHYYGMMLLDRGQSARSVFEWRFTDKSDVSLFMNCQKGEVLTSVKFEIYGCEFYLELTPNGWTHQRDGQACVWLAVASLHSDIRSVDVQFRTKCAEIGLEEDRPTTTLMQPQDGSFSATANDKMHRSQFDGLTQWTFECTVDIVNINYRDMRQWHPPSMAPEVDEEMQSEMKVLRESNEQLTVKLLVFFRNVTAVVVPQGYFYRVIFIIYDLWMRDIEFQLCRYECGEYF